jgi:hypothetical protein
MAQRPVYAQPRSDRATVNPQLVAAARASFDKHRRRSATRTWSASSISRKVSREPRYYLLDTNSGQVTQHHVSHGRGSDPGAHRLGAAILQPPRLQCELGRRLRHREVYHGKYGRSMRVRGLDWSNSNAHARAIVIHPAWYAEQTTSPRTACSAAARAAFAMSRTSLSETLNRLKPRHFRYAARDLSALPPQNEKPRLDYSRGFFSRGLSALSQLPLSERRWRGGRAVSAWRTRPSRP